MGEEKHCCLCILLLQWWEAGEVPAPWATNGKPCLRNLSTMGILRLTQTEAQNTFWMQQSTHFSIYTVRSGLLLIKWRLGSKTSASLKHITVRSAFQANEVRYKYSHVTKDADIICGYFTSCFVSEIGRSYAKLKIIASINQVSTRKNYGYSYRQHLFKYLA